MKKPLAYLPTLPSIQSSPRPGELAGPAPGNLGTGSVGTGSVGTGDLGALPNSRAPPGPPSLPTDPEALVSSALSMLAGHKFVPGPAVDVPLPQLPPLRADASPAGVGPLTSPTALPLQLRTLSDGSLCTLPIRYFDAQLLIATYLADYGHELMLVQIWDEEDRVPPWTGELELRDAETGTDLKLDFDDESRRRYTHAFDEYASAIQTMALRSSGRYAGVSTAQPLESVVFGDLIRMRGIA